MQLVHFHCADIEEVTAKKVMKQMKPLNVRVEPELHRLLRVVAVSGFGSMPKLHRAMVKLWFGVKLDPKLERQRRADIELMNKLTEEGERPFDHAEGIRRN